MKSIYLYVSLLIAASMLMPSPYLITGGSQQTVPAVNAMAPYTQS